MAPPGAASEASAYQTSDAARQALDGGARDSGRTWQGGGMRRALVPAVLAPALALAACSSSGSSAGCAPPYRLGGDDDHDEPPATTSRRPRPDGRTTPAPAATTPPVHDRRDGPGHDGRGDVGGEGHCRRLPQDVPAGGDRPRGRRAWPAGSTPATLASMRTPSPTARRRPTRRPPTSSTGSPCASRRATWTARSPSSRRARRLSRRTRPSCVVHNANHAFASDPDLLALASSDQSSQEWPAPQRAKVRAAIATCAPAALIDQILSTI